MALGLASLVLVALLVGAIWLVVRRRRRALPSARILALPPASALVAKEERPPPHVVLVHGLAGFEEIRFGGLRASYFRGVRERLEQLGISCTTAKLPALAPVAERATILEALLASLGNVEAHVIAHSMGGLDARRAVSSLGATTSVRTLVTVATPHRGTPLADFSPQLLALRDLSRASAVGMNDELLDVPGVRYGSVVVAPSRGALGVHPLLRGSYLLLKAVAGQNDGLVPVSSQTWGETLATIDADHWGAIGWSGEFEAPAFYERS